MRSLMRNSVECGEWRVELRTGVMAGVLGSPVFSK